MYSEQFRQVIKAQNENKQFENKKIIKYNGMPDKLRQK
jgi:hypothetical protein